MPNSGPGGAFKSMAPVLFGGQAVRAWRCWFADGVTYDSERNRWGDVPIVGLQVLITYHDGHTRMAWSGYDAYALPGVPGRRLGAMLGELNGPSFEHLRRRALDDPWRPRGW